ncbi:MAG: hypothetical protein FWD78_01600 [Treponema sp.]|nr:hypothetical protein [Treponema sp.]
MADKNNRDSGLPQQRELPLKAPNCFQCRHFKISWDPAFPHSCTVFGVKCKNLPSMEIFLSTGKHCFLFDKKEGLK